MRQGMKRSRFKDEQVIGTLKEHQSGPALPQTWRQRSNLSHLASEVWWRRCVRSSATGIDRGAGCPAEEALGGVED